MVLALLCAAQFVAVLDTTIVAVALPDIERELGFGPASLQWVVTAYTLAFGGLLIPGGRAGDVFGRRRLFIAGLALFTCASAGCGLAGTPAALVALRAVQGAGCALMTPAALALVTALPGRPLGLWTAAAAGGGASGWVLGGLLTEHFGWRAIFFVNLPLGIAGVVLAALLLASADRSTPASSPRASLDLRGAAVVTAALVALVLGFTQAETRGFASPVVLLAFAAAAVLFPAFLAIERRERDPLLPLTVLGNRPFVRANLVAAALTGATTPPMLLSILHQQQDLGRSATETGLACLPFNVAVIAGSFVGNRVGHMAAGLLAVAAGALLFTTGALIPASAVMGFGLGVASVGSTAAGTSALSERPGLASGLLNSAAQVGTVLGVALIVSLAAATSYDWGFAGAAMIALAGAATQLPRRSRCSYAPEAGAGG
jgi:MFS family permease